MSVHQDTRVPLARRGHLENRHTEWIRPGTAEHLGLPVEGIALIIGIDRLLDMMRTAVNVTGDSVVTCVVARTEGELDLDTFNDPDAAPQPASMTEPLKP